MISAGDFRNGVTFEMEGNVYAIIEFQHVKPGKGAAFVRTKIRNVISGAVTEKTFNPNDKYPTAFIERKDMQYLYNDGDLYYFMDNETYEQIPINANILGDNFKFVTENMECKVLSYKGNVFGVEPPNFVVLTVTETEPGVKGDTATNVTKPAKLETGAEVKVLDAMLTLLEDMALSISDLEEAYEDMADQLDAVDEDLCTLEDDFYEEDKCCEDCEDDDDEFYYEVTCPNCQETICLSEDIIEEGQIDCPNCGECLEFDINDVLDDYGCGDDCDCHDDCCGGSHKEEKSGSGCGCGNH